VIPDEETLPAAQVYSDLPAPGNRKGPALLLQVLQAHLHSASTYHPLLLEAQAEGHLQGVDRLVGRDAQDPGGPGS